jgi:HPt (histidine-containing phosphotransfer) domain-containing protein
MTDESKTAPSLDDLVAAAQQAPATVDWEAVAIKNAARAQDLERRLQECIATLQAANVELGERTAELEIINSVQQALSSQLDFQAIIELVGDTLRDLFGGVSTSIALYDEASNRIETPYFLATDGHRVHAFTEDDLSLLSTIAATVGVVLHNALLYQETERRASQMATIAEVGREVSATPEREAVLTSIARHVHSLFQAQDTILRLLEPDGEAFRTIVALGRYADEFKADVVTQAAFEALIRSVGGDLEFLRELIDTYFEDSPKLLAALHAALAAGNTAEFRRAAHSLKSASASMGAMGSSRMCQEMEEIGKACALDGADATLGRAEEEYTRVRAALESVATS